MDDRMAEMGCRRQGGALAPAGAADRPPATGLPIAGWRPGGVFPVRPRACQAAAPHRSHPMQREPINTLATTRRGRRRHQRRAQRSGQRAWPLRQQA
jgi:hypothetical protein